MDLPFPKRLNKVNFRLRIILIMSFVWHYAYAQVSFQVSEENGGAVVSSFTDKQLTLALEQETVTPQEILKVFVNPDTAIEDQVSILGMYQVEAGRIAFRPVVPFSKSLSYLAVFGDSIIYPFQFEMPADLQTTSLLDIYPTKDTVPANLLKIYLHFSAPMREGEVYQRTHLYDQHGNQVKDPFVPLQPELWDSTGQRITLWVDPGRVKTGLYSRETYGPVIEAGKVYHLTVDSLWKDIHGQTLDGKYRKQLVVVGPDRRKPDIGQWALSLPYPGTRDPLIIEFNEIMDIATSRKAIIVLDSNGDKLVGNVKIGKNESSWLFVPEIQWESGTFQLRILSKLEDLAGNNLNRVFDRDILQNNEIPSDQEFHWIAVEIKRSN